MDFNRHLILVIFICLIFTNGFAQQNQFLKNTDQLSGIKEIRESLLESIEKFDIEDVKTEIDNIIYSGNDINKVLWLYEKWNISYYTGDYTTILNELSLHDSIRNIQHFNRMPVYDDLSKYLILHTNNNKDTLLNKLTGSDLNQKEIDFLLLLLKYLINDDEYIKLNQDSINIIASEYLNQYPSTAYNNFIKNKIMKTYKKSDFDFGFNVFSGYMKMQNQLSDYFYNAFIYGFETKIYYKDIFLSLGFLLGGNQNIRNSFSYVNKDWNEGTTLNLFCPNVLAGYKISLHKTFNVNPYVGIGVSSLYDAEETSDEGDEENDKNIGPALSILSGLESIYYFKTNKKSEIDRIIEINWKIKLKLGMIHPYYYQVNNSLKGNIIYINLGFGADFNTYFLKYF